MSDPSLQELVQTLFKSTKQTDKILASLNKITERIDTWYAPRAEFERWRDSVEGKAWKHQKFKAQKRLCAICKEAIELKGSHIDHIKPISLHPKLALSLENLQIACPGCNTSKGNGTNNGKHNDRLTY
ncbi:MAG: HNH endonuclease [Trichocoleus desertorum ATA4-8-CV12]|jgi:5-methylcytosine-specific restriction endonuclease McrA|nr:HNH endonuclease [Trichocoleus desertorum ATA4-8-CV12]